jgi:hypothetical protein
MVIHCIRNGNVQNNDDRIVITPYSPSIHSEVQSLEYAVTHTISGAATCSTNPIVTQTRVQRCDLPQYLSSLILMLSVDNDPFEYIQFGLPGIPDTMLTPAAALLLLPTLVSELKRMTLCWPDDLSREQRESATQTQQPHQQTQPNIRVNVASGARHIFFDEDGSIIRQYY